MFAERLDLLTAHRPRAARIRARDGVRAAAACRGGVTVVLAERRRPLHALADFGELDPRACDLAVVVKVGAGMSCDHRARFVTDRLEESAGVTAVACVT